MLVFVGDPTNTVYTCSLPTGGWASTPTYWFTPTSGNFPYGAEVWPD